MAITGASLRAKALIVEFNAAGDAVRARLDSELVHSVGGAYLAPARLRTFSTQELVDAGVTAQQVTGIENVVEALRAELEAELLE